MDEAFLVTEDQYYMDKPLSFVKWEESYFSYSLILLEVNWE